MEIKIENKTIKSFREISRQIKKIQETAETVVPDINDDIGKIVSTNTALFLKSKEVSGRGVLIGGEAEISVLYITEGESTVSFLRTTKAFTMEYDVDGADNDTVAQIALSVTNAETRVLNPRKVSVTVEISGEMSCFKQENAIVQSMLPGSDFTIHTKTETESAVLINSACEKTFAYNEQFTFPSAKPVPQRLIWQEPVFEISETQLVGTKALVKGSFRVTVLYLSDSGEYPIQWSFSAPFSQLLDIGQEKMDLAAVRIEISSSYFALVDTISGEKALDAEIHAVMQLLSYFHQDLSYISDAYCNCLPLSCKMQPERLCGLSDVQRMLLSADEQISIAEDCADVLSVHSALTAASLSRSRAEAGLAVDILYQTQSGSLSAVHRSIMLEQECALADVRLTGARLVSADLRSEGSSLSGRISIELSYRSSSVREVSMVESMELDEEKPFDLSLFPSVTLVRAEEESVWELAKKYHSCPERITAVNCFEADVRGCMLMIPKSN